LVTGAAFKKLILERLPHKFLEQMHTVDLTGRTDQRIISIIMNAGWTAEKYDAARKNLGLKASVRSYEKEDWRSKKKVQRKSTNYEKKSSDKLKRNKFK